MVTVTIDPVLIHFGHFAVRWYSIIVLTAILVGLWITGREARRKGLDVDKVYETALWVVMAGILGARLFHVIDQWSMQYAANPIRVLYVWEGGLAIWGGVIGGLAALAWSAWRKGWPFGRLLDAFAPGLVLGQAVGRAACLITGDAVGRPTSGPLGVAYTSPQAMVPELGVYYTPTPAYELLMNLAIFGLLWSLRKRDLPNGALFLVYLVAYAAGRFVITFWNTYQIVALGLNQAQLISLVALMVGIPLLVYVLLGRRGEPTLLR